MSPHFASRPGPAGRSEDVSRIVLLLTGLQTGSAALAFALAAGYAAHEWITDSAFSSELEHVAAPLVFTCCAAVAFGLAFKGRRAGVALVAVLPAATQAWMLLWRAPLYDWPRQVFLMPLGEPTQAPYPPMMLATDLLAMLSIPLGVTAAAVVLLGRKPAALAAERDGGYGRRWIPQVVLAVLAVGAAGTYGLSFWIAELAEGEALLLINGPRVGDRALAVAGAAMVAVLVEALGAFQENRWSRWASGAAGVVLLAPAGWDVWELSRALMAPQRVFITLGDAVSRHDWTKPVSKALNLGAWQATMLVLALAMLLGIAGIARAIRAPGTAQDSL